MEQVIAKTILKVMRPLIRLLVQRGMPFVTFMEYVKWVYVQVASEDRADPLKRVSNSRIAAITGISRHEVKKLLEQKVPDETEALYKHHKPARVISGWLSDKSYLNAKQLPKILPMDGEISFVSLIEKYGGDMPVKPIMEELLRIGSVRIEDNMVELISEAYIPHSADEHKIEILGDDVSDLISTIHHNIQNDGKEDYLQLKAMGNQISWEGKTYLRKISKDKGIQFLKEIDAFITQEEIKTKEKSSNEGTYRVGVGVYYFEEKIKGE